MVINKKNFVSLCMVTAFFSFVLGLVFAVCGQYLLFRVAWVAAAVIFFTPYVLLSLRPLQARKKDNCTSSLDDLNQQVTAAICGLEHAQRKLSHLEEMIANLTTPSSVEGQVARRGAVRSAVEGRDEERAKELVKRFLAEDGISAKLGDELRALLDQAYSHLKTK